MQTILPVNPTFFFIINELRVLQGRIVSNEGGQAIVKSTILMAEKLGLNVVAEGVEDEHQLAMLQQMGCYEIQGYYFSKPVPADRFAVLLKNGFDGKVNC